MVFEEGSNGEEVDHENFTVGVMPPNQADLVEQMLGNNVASEKSGNDQSASVVDDIFNSFISQNNSNVIASDPLS